MARVDLFDGVDMGTFQPSALSNATIIAQSPAQQVVDFAGGAARLTLTGENLGYNASGSLIAGIVTGVDIVSPNGHFSLTGARADAAVLALASATNDGQLSISTLLAGDDVITVHGTSPPATDSAFTAMAWGGNDLMIGGGSRSSLYGGDGDDTLQATTGDGNYLRGDAGGDTIAGAVGFDDINGNMGNDTCAGGPGADWVVGGKDEDRLFGGDHADLVYGNLGHDTIQGDGGSDVIRGGQGNDVASGGDGDDFISGDRGDDTVVGGAGADLFHGSQDAGIDRVLDFRISEGDRVVLDPGTTYTLAQVGADTVLDMGGGHQMILVNVTLSALPAGWIFGA